MESNVLTQDVASTVSQIFDLGMTTLTLRKLLFAVLLLVACIIVMKVLMKIIDRAITGLKVDRGTHTFLKSAISILLWFITILIVAIFLGVDATSLIAILSVVGLAVSLAIQSTLSNLAGGIMLLVSKPFKADDVIEADGINGRVNEVGLVYTRITTYDNKLIFVPNSEISSMKITNYTAEGNRRVDLTFCASYDDPIDKVKETIRAVIDAHPLTLFTPEPFVRVSAYQDSSIEYTVRVWCATTDYWEVHHDLLEQVKVAFDRNGIQMTYDHLIVHMSKN